MDEAFKILVIIVSSVLSLFLLLSIVAVIFVIKLVRDIRRITAKAEHVIGSVESVGDVFRQVSGPLGLVKVVSNIIKTVKKKG